MALKAKTKEHERADAARESTAVAKQESTITAVNPELRDSMYESLALAGDLSQLNAAEKTAYYRALCERLGLDPATQPFAPLRLNGKEILYPLRGATDQLARLHNVNRRITDETRMGDVYIVTVEAALPNGRTEQSKGAVTIGNLKGDALCNAIMKAETKAKRRATLSILGLGMLDETELDTIPEYANANRPATKSELVEAARESVASSAVGETQSNDVSAMAEIEMKALQAGVGTLCRELNAAGDSIKWGESTLVEYCGSLLGIDDLTVEAMKSLTLEDWEKINIDLTNRLDSMR